MSIQVAIRHRTKYTYDRFVKLWPQSIRLRPAPHTRTPILGYALKIQPEEHFINWQQDPFGNYVARVVFPEKTREFQVDVEVIAEMVSINPFDFFLEEYAEKVPFHYDAQLKKELSPYLEIKEAGPLLQSWVTQAKDFQNQHERTVDFLVSLNQALNQEIEYSIRMEPGIQACEVTLGKAIGSCRDSAWVMVQLLRHLGMAARFVSGYLVQLTADEKVLDGPSGPETDFTDLHAWAEVYLPGAGWVGMDVTSGLLAGEGHIPLACTPDPSSAAPISGGLEKCETTFSFENIVERIWERPRVSKPLNDSQWEEALALGYKVEEEMQAADMRLTMGGEPTFVSSLDMESAQWNNQADGLDKRRMAWDLSERLLGHFGKGGFVHSGQGKWYPGEPIPRWQHIIYWRKDGQTIWQNPSLLANPNESYAIDVQTSQTFLQKLAGKLGVAHSNCIAAFEDEFYYMWEQGNLPVNLDPNDPNPEGKLERKNLAEILERGMDTPRGFVLPLTWNISNQKWQSCKWIFKRKQLFLLPGNSAMGVRLPLDRLPFQVPEQEEPIVESSPLESHTELAGFDSLNERIINRKGQENEVSTHAAPSQKAEHPGEYRPLYLIQTIKTAICAEVRNGKLYLFLPPISYMDNFLDLLRSIEQVAEEMNQPIVLEGYQPPFDAGVQKLGVTPDPGVIEVNIHPAQSWGELVDNYDVLFEKAQESRLGTEKFMIDGKHTGTGGGNHITLGGLSPADSPFLRRPDLLRSFVNFWQNHPGLSYLFSSAFVGPTSQAPRVDEGRQGMLYELQLAFNELDRHPKPQPWLVDRLFRNLLIDMTGNTHRAEFCIDKLYSPDSQSGRLGILEMRGFDMPPHKHMALLQLLLIRSLALAFWKKPYKRKLVDWGTRLYDKFLIHQFVKEDMEEVCEYLQREGIAFKMEWLNSFFEFRFPLLGQINMGNIHMEVRAGIEPWNVLGEEMGSGGTARFVDSSVERVEVLIRGIERERYQLLCNQTIVPLTETREKGTFVAAIRYKAWNPPSALHPTIGVDTPLVFDLFDTWNERSVGGCTYYVSHPGGRAYDTFPINSYEADSRRVNRFYGQSHTPSEIIPPVPLTKFDPPQRFVSEKYTPATAFVRKTVPVDPDFPHTLDLRRVEK
ncbi:MAG: transglutaminase family protein [Bacteroidota bacterium]